MAVRKNDLMPFVHLSSPSNTHKETNENNKIKETPAKKTNGIDVYKKNCKKQLRHHFFFFLQLSHLVVCVCVWHEEITRSIVSTLHAVTSVLM